MQIDLQFQTDHLTRVLEAVRQEIATPQQMLGSIGESLLNVNQDRHAKGLAPDGSKWKPLAPLTLGTKVWAAQKKAYKGDGVYKGHNGKAGAHSLAVAAKVRSRTAILRDSGQMLDSFNYQVQGDTLRFGFDGARNAQLASWHHNGTGSFGPAGKPYLIRPVNKKALGFAGLVVKRVNHPGIPARPLVGFPASDRKLVGEVVTDHLKLVLQRAR